MLRKRVTEGPDALSELARLVFLISPTILATE